MIGATPLSIQLEKQLKELPNKVQEIYTTVNKVRDEAAQGLKKYKTLGPDAKTPYVMNYQDFNKMGIYQIAYGNSAALPAGVTGDLWVFNVYGGDPKYITLIAASPRGDRIFFGKFWNGVWQGWETYLSTHGGLISPTGSNEALRISKNQQNRASITLGCNPGTTSGMPNQNGGWLIESNSNGLVIGNQTNDPSKAAISVSNDETVTANKLNTSTLNASSVNTSTLFVGGAKIWVE